MSMSYLRIALLEHSRATILPKIFHHRSFSQANWLKANHHCMQNNMHLASIYSKDENDQLKKQIIEGGKFNRKKLCKYYISVLLFSVINVFLEITDVSLLWFIFIWWSYVDLTLWIGYEDHYWIGLTLLGDSNYYWYGHNKPISFQNWNGGQAFSTQCVTIKKPDIKWEYADCGNQNFFVCEIHTPWWNVLDVLCRPLQINFEKYERNKIDKIKYTIYSMQDMLTIGICFHNTYYIQE